VDHPFRSFKPRFSLTLAHPAARAHYAELITNLVRQAPEQAFMAIWSNDSGSGFEHTKSLYVGRNGGPYLVREWKDDDEIARLAAENVARYYRVLRDAASKVHPGFRVITRLESFYGERKHLWPLLRDGIDVEVNSLLTSGWENNYPHPSYKDQQVLGSLYHNSLSAGEGEAAAELAGRGSRAYFFHYFAAFGNFEPLIGTPFPWLTYEKLKSAAERKVPGLAQMGGLHPPDKAPYAVNQDVFRAFQLDADMDFGASVLAIAARYAGPRWAARLARGWRAAGAWWIRPSARPCRCPSIPGSGRSGTGSWCGRSSPTSKPSSSRSGPIMKRSWSAPFTTPTRSTWPRTSSSSWCRPR
jgi:hypothetical protein